MRATPDSTSTNPEQRIADLERQLAQRDAALAERDAVLAEAREQQTATAEVLQVINSSPGNLTPVFDKILEKAHTLCGAALGSLVIYDGKHFCAVATRGLSTEFDKLVRKPFVPTVGSTFTQAVRGTNVLHITDVAQAPDRENPLRVAVIGSEGARTLLQIALRKDDQLLGAFSIFRREVRPFTDKQIALLQNFAAQAVIAMENARLLSELQARTAELAERNTAFAERIDHQAATIDVLKEMSASPADAQPVFDLICDQARALTGVRNVSLFEYDGTLVHPRAWTRDADHYDPTAKAAYDATFPRVPDRGSLTCRAILDGTTVHIRDMDAEPGVSAEVRALGNKTQVSIPLMRDSRAIGALTTASPRVDDTSDTQIELLQTFAEQAVIAIQSAETWRELQARTRDLEESLEYQTATSDVLNVISRSTFDLQPVLDTLVETASRLCDADFGALSAREGDAYRVRATSALVSEFDQFLRGQLFTPSRATVTGRALLERQTVHIADASTDPELAIPEAITVGRLRTMLGVPLLREGEPLGVFVLSRERVEPFTDRQVELVRTFADQGVIAMENARLLGELHQRTDEVAELNRGLEARVAEQVDELGRVGRLKRFLAPQLAELIVSQGDEKILESHRREIVVVFCDLRGYTAFTETAEPEEVLDFLRQYHGALGPLVSQFEGTLDQFSGDGIMVFFNDPVPCPDPAERAVKMAVAIREAAAELITAWRTRGCELGSGVGIGWGYATLGQIGFTDRSGYTAIGTVCNLAARLCDEAKDGQILITGRVAAAVGRLGSLEDLGNLELKGLSRPVAAFNVAQNTNATDTRPSLTVIANEPGA